MSYKGIILLDSFRSYCLATDADMLETDFMARCECASDDEIVCHVAVGRHRDGYVVPEFFILAVDTEAALETAEEYYRSHLTERPDDECCEVAMVITTVPATKIRDLMGKLG